MAGGGLGTFPIDSRLAIPVPGPAKACRLDEPMVVSLEELVLAANLYRHLEVELDLSFVRAWMQELYAERGRPSTDPAVFFNLQLVMVFEGIRSERNLKATGSVCPVRTTSTQRACVQHLLKLRPHHAPCQATADP
jgi:hypothetical protein